jgi:hypothetical protein
MSHKETFNLYKSMISNKFTLFFPTAYRPRKRKPLIQPVRQGIFKTFHPFSLQFVQAKQAFFFSLACTQPPFLQQHPSLSAICTG